MDDDIQMCEQLSTLLNEFLGDSSEISDYRSGEEFLTAWETADFDLIILDIFMDKLTGVDVARKIRERDSNVKIVFSTTSNEFASESYEVKAEDYLIKPFNKERLEKTLERLVIKKKKEDKILKFSENKVVHVDSIVYTTFSGHYVTIYLKDETSIQVRCTQKNFEKQIEHFPQLISSFKGITVNLAQVDNIESDRFKMKNGSFVPISRRKYAEIKKAYTRFLIETLKE